MQKVEAAEEVLLAYSLTQIVGHNDPAFAPLPTQVLQTLCRVTNEVVQTGPANIRNSFMTWHGPKRPLYSPEDQICLSPVYISSFLLTESLTVGGEDDSRVGDRDIVPTSLLPYDSLVAKV